MKATIAGAVLSVVLMGCVEATVEVTEPFADGWARTIMRGDVRHGWEVQLSAEGRQLWILWLDDIYSGCLIIESSGEVSQVSYEDSSYHMMVKYFEPGESLGNDTLQVLYKVQREAQRRQIELPHRHHQIASRQIADAPTHTEAALLSPTQVPQGPFGDEGVSAF